MVIKITRVSVTAESASQPTMDEDAGADMDLHFVSAYTYLNEHPGIASSNDTLLKLYAYYKQAIQGDCTIPKPGLFEFVARAKWDAWKGLEGLGRGEAMRDYVETVIGMRCGWDPEGNHREEEAEGAGGEEVSFRSRGVGVEEK
ncbi:acyl-CoA-binding protein [Jimgerdemannia flammicorona]|uniref:Acyl-CoA-binding protein n=1 Tax=Jimgerdemannia flammicorona TaxID=994334 RepID=A0A433BA03_9FUNG|nr:acyl-CoA-binding protein [Jimgerdemannia flammicorona]